MKKRLVKTEAEARLGAVFEKLGVSFPQQRPSQEEMVEKILSASQVEGVATKSILLEEKQYGDALREFLRSGGDASPQLWLDPMPCAVTGRPLEVGEIIWMADLLGCMGLEVSLDQIQERVRERFAS